MKLLVIESDSSVAKYLCRAFRELGREIDRAESLRDGLTMAVTGTYNVLILDRVLPDGDGLTIVRTLRASGVMTPVLVLTALNGVEERVEGLEAGADDYLSKPFAFSELNARVNALSRRASPQSVQTTMSIGDLHLDVLQRRVSRAGERIDLQPREFKLLEYLMRHAGRTVTRTMLLEAIWSYHFDPKTNIVETHISRLRSKLNRGSGPELIHTVRGAGYCLRAADQGV